MRLSDVALACASLALDCRCRAVLASPRRPGKTTAAQVAAALLAVRRPPAIQPATGIIVIGGPS